MASRQTAVSPTKLERMRGVPLNPGGYLTWRESRARRGDSNWKRC
jgi:hypothetical protein